MTPHRRLAAAISSPWEPVVRIIPDGMESVRDTLIELCDVEHCDLVLTTGGTGPSPRDLTPEAMKAVLEKELPGFGELMRQVSFARMSPAVLFAPDGRCSRQDIDHQCSGQAVVNQNLF